MELYWHYGICVLHCNSYLIDQSYLITDLGFHVSSLLTVTTPLPCRAAPLSVSYCI